MRNLIVPIGILHALVFAAAVPMGISSQWKGDWLVQVGILLVLSFILSYWIRARAPAIGSLYPLVCQVFCLTVAHYLFGLNPLLTSLLAAIPMLEFVGWFRYRWFVIAVLEVGLILLLSLHPFASLEWTVADTQPVDLFLTIALVVVSSLYAERHYRLVESEASQKSEIASLQHSVGTLLNANLDFQDYAVKVGETSVIQERKRLSREIHDVVGYTLTNVRMMLEHATDMVEKQDPALGGLLTEAREEVQTGLHETRKVLRQFREIENSSVDGIPYIQKLVKTFSHATGIEVRVSYGNLPWTFPPQYSTVLYRIVQESMTNAFRHGRATLVQIQFWIAHQKLFVNIEDNGTGGTSLTPGIGLTGMAERVGQLGGVLNTQGLGRGFSLRVEIPFPEYHDESIRGNHGA